MNEKVIGHFLAYKRAQVDPAILGITDLTHRRVAGLRRDEVAERAHISTDWYTRLEQGRTGLNPSPDVLLAISHVLQLTVSEQQYLFNLLGAQLPADEPRIGTLEPSLVQLLHAQTPNPAVILDQLLTIQASNLAYDAVYGPLKARNRIEYNLLWQVFNAPQQRQLVTDWTDYAYQRVAQFRQLYSRYPDDPTLYAVYDALKPEATFQAAWQALATDNFSPTPRLLIHPQVGTLYLNELVLQPLGQTNYLLIKSAADQASLQRLQNLVASQH
ncbi:helix-turn-helix domain-containing protein [Lactiplantibacillus fabifermentans]|uniref:XRE family transcriptional regulator n=1 Tax=Lactiplantibacillus fabifermentans DSM 21115 TaxID=1413187 RepID=A0A0R2NFM1_9LACO|nr:helix-turn-helix transcriptional regulator [Lactiplantibacillus fabifermentans]KRO24631.1 XRE family transcriptional regulator [Lactiplantibacillus fabifermentans DSM 21115]